MTTTTETATLNSRQKELTERLAELHKAGETKLTELRETSENAGHIAKLEKALRKRMDGALENLERSNEQESLDIPNVRRSWQRQAERNIDYYAGILENQSKEPTPQDIICRNCGLVNPSMMNPTCRSCYAHEVDNTVMRLP